MAPRLVQTQQSVKDEGGCSQVARRDVAGTRAAGNERNRGAPRLRTESGIANNDTGHKGASGVAPT